MQPRMEHISVPSAENAGVETPALLVSENT